MPEERFMARLPPHTSLSPVRFPDDVAAVYRRALDALEGAGVRFVVGGAIAFNHYTGIWRDTKDLDVFCLPEEGRRVLDVLAAAGFETELVYESWLGKAWVGDVFVDVIWRNANALFPVRDGWIDEAPRVPLLGHHVPILPLEPLILSKMMVAGRYRFDGADLLHLIHAAGEGIRWDRLADGAGEHVELLLAYLHMYRWGYPGWRDRVPDEVVRDYEARARRAGSSYGPFRALLLDLQSFHVDVSGWGMPNPHRQALEEIFGDADGRQ